MQTTKGRVILVGAGPGDPELLTVKAMRWLARAEVILTDRLASPEILELYANPEAEIIYVGKQCGKTASVSQSAINELLVHHASRGRLVVRLKGGDVSVFSNVLDELETLRQHHIPYEIVPGITAASGASAYSGIPLTARGYSNAVRFLTFHRPDLLPERHWKELARTDDTLVFYMSGEQLTLLAQKLTRHGLGPDKLFALIDQATTPHQQVRVFDPYDEAAVQRIVAASPALIMVGRVVDLHHRYQWIPSANTALPGDYFIPVEAPVVPCTETETFSEQLTA